MNAFSQRGVTLISLLVGLLTSMLAILGMTALFRVVIKNNTEATLTARTTSERAAAILITDMHIQDAGFGTDGTAQKNLLLLQDASLSGSGRLSGTPAASLSVPGEVKGNALLWRYKQDIEAGDHYCAGLFAGEGQGILYLYPQLCSPDVSQVLTLDWTVQPLVEDARFELALTYHADVEPCRSFGVAGAGFLSARLTTVHQAGEQEIPLSSTTCLLNFQDGHTPNPLGL